MLWKKDWPQIKPRFAQWWQGEGLVCMITAPRDKPLEDLPEPEAPDDPRARWCDLDYRIRAAEYGLSRTYFGGDAFPSLRPTLGPGSLAALVGAETHFVVGTAWYEPCITNPDSHPPLRLDTEGEMFALHVEFIQRAVESAGGRFLVTLPELIEHFDILSALRGPQHLMLDLLDRPAWVKKACAELNAAYREMYEICYNLIKDAEGGSAQWTYGPGRTAKLQCDAAAMLSPAQFAEFVVPFLQEQCAWLDYPFFHLDGTDCLRHLDHLLAMEGLRAVQWTPQSRADLPDVGEPHWFDLYKRILQAGKSVQLWGVEPDQVFPLLDAVGPKGLHILVNTKTEDEARRLEEKVETYRPQG